MTNAVYLAIFLHFARKTVRKLAESKEERARSLAARMEDNVIKVYRDIYDDPSKCIVGYKGYSNMPYKVTFALRHLYTDGHPKDSYELVKDIAAHHYPRMVEKR